MQAPPDSRERSIYVTRVPHHNPLISFARALLREILNDNVIDGAAVLAFFSLLAVFPAAIFVFSLLPSLSIPHLQQAIFDLLHQVLPNQSADFFVGTSRYAVAEGKQGLLAFELIFALWSGSAGVYTLMEQLTVIADVKECRPYWKVRGIAILLMVFFASLMIGSLSLVIFGGVVQSWVASMVGWSRPLLLFFATLRWAIISAALLFALSVAYRIGPYAKIRYRFISPGNVIAALLIAVASIGFRIYVATFGGYDAIYGSIAAIIILMLWMYLAGFAILVGFEIDTLRQQRR
jgi:membrane protein